MQLEFNPMDFVEMLPKMGLGMLAIFIVIGAIAVSTYALNAIFSKKKK